MIEKIDFDSADPREMQIDIWQKLNEVIDLVNKHEEINHFPEMDELAEASLKAARTGSHADLKAWLELRRKYL